MLRFRFLSFKTGFVAVASLLIASSAVQAGRGIVRFGGLPYRGVAVSRYGGIGYVRPAYYGGISRGYGYGLYGRGYGYSGFGLGLGTGLGLGYGLGYGIGGYGSGLGIGSYSSGYGSYGLGSGGYGSGAPATGYGNYSSGYPANNGYGVPPTDSGYPGNNDGYGVPPAGSATPYAPGNSPANPDENYSPPPQAQQQTPPQRTPEEQLPAVQRNENTASVTVVVPEGTELWFNGTRTTQVGPQRKFVTPALTPGEDFIYTAKARWMMNGKPIEQTRSIHVQANSSQVIDFTK